MISHFLGKPTFVLGILSAFALLTAVACGASATPTPVPPTPTNTPAPVATNTATPKPATPTPQSATVVVASPTATVVPTPTPAPTTKPKTGGILHQVLTDDPNGYDAHVQTSGVDNGQNAKLYSNLIWRPNGSQLVPDAATSYDISTDGMTWTFHLNPNAKFQTGYTPANPRDGTSITAQDVKWSLEKIMGLHTDPLSARAGLMKEFINIDRADSGLEVVDTQTVKVHLKQPASVLADIMATGFAAIMPDGITSKDLTKRPYGSGPFIVKNVQRGSAYDYVRNPNYFKPGLPYLDGWSMPLIVDQSVTQAAFLTGKLDLYGGNPTADNKPLFDKKTKAGQITQAPWGSGCHPQGLNFNITKPPFDNLQLRQAINLGLDRQAYIQAVHGGYASPSVYLDTNLDGSGFGKTPVQIMQLPGYRLPHDADLAQAKQIIHSLYPNGLDVTMMVRNLGSGIGSYPQEGEFVASDLKNLGINVTVQLQPAATTFDRAAKLDYSIWSYHYCSTTWTPEELYGGYFVTGASRNWTGYSNPKIDAGYPDLIATTDPVARKQKAQALEDIIYADLPIAPEPEQTSPRNYYNYVKDVPLTVGGGYMDQKAELMWRSDV